MKFSLRSLFVLTTVAAVLFAIGVKYSLFMLIFAEMLLVYVCFILAYTACLFAGYRLFHACRRSVAFLMSKTRTP